MFNLPGTSCLSKPASKHWNSSLNAVEILGLSHCVAGTCAESKTRIDQDIVISGTCDTWNGGARDALGIRLSGMVKRIAKSISEICRVKVFH